MIEKPLVAEDRAPWLVVGLGNPGPQYSGNRHNVGFMVAELLAGRMGVRLARHRRVVAEAAEGRLGLGGPQVVVTRPMAFMNLSGGSVAGLLRSYEISVDHVIVVHDELDIPYTQVRVKRGGGEGGHNGLRSISRSLDSKEYARIRCGIGRPSGQMEAADYVLANFSSVERKELGYVTDRAADAVEAVIKHGVDWAQNAFNGA